MVAFGAGMTAGMGASFANDACTVVSGTHTYQCSGNQSGGVVFDGARFVGFRGAIAPMQASSDVSRTYGEVMLGLDINQDGKVKVWAYLFGQFSSSSNQIGGSLQMRMAF